jgi:hypothetical protein
MIIYLDPFTVTLVYHRAVNELLDIFEHANVLGYADDLKLYMTVEIEAVEDFNRF